MQLLLDHVSKWVNLSPDEVAIFLQHWEVQEFQKGEYVLYNGKICQYDAFLLTGSVKGYYIDPVTAKEEIVFLAIADWWASDLESFHQGSPSMLNIQVVSDAELALISKSNFESLMRMIPKLERYFRIILQGYTSALLRRVYMRNALPARERYLQFIGQYPALNQNLPQYLIASYLGMSAEMVSKIRAELKS